jgi:hypothetical protein
VRVQRPNTLCAGKKKLTRCQATILIGCGIRGIRHIPDVNSRRHDVVCPLAAEVNSFGNSLTGGILRLQLDEFSLKTSNLILFKCPILLRWRLNFILPLIYKNTLPSSSNTHTIENMVKVKIIQWVFLFFFLIGLLSPERCQIFIIYKLMFWQTKINQRTS